MPSLDSCSTNEGSTVLYSYTKDNNNVRCDILNLLFSVTQTYEEDIPDYMLGGNYLYTETEATESTTLRPYIDPSTPTNVTVIKGKTAMLACVVRNVGKAAVSRFFVH